MGGYYLHPDGDIDIHPMELNRLYISCFPVYLVDIWNVIEAFRENNLNSQDSVSEVYTTNLESVIQSIYSALNKRLPNSAQIDIGESVNLLNNWLLNIYDP